METEGCIAKAEAKLETMGLIIKDMLKTQMVHIEKINDQEARARCQNLRIYNVSIKGKNVSQWRLLWRSFSESHLKSLNLLIQIKRAH